MVCSNLYWCMLNDITLILPVCVCYGVNFTDMMTSNVSFKCTHFANVFAWLWYYCVYVYVCVCVCVCVLFVCALCMWRGYLVRQPSSLSLSYSPLYFVVFSNKFKYNSNKIWLHLSADYHLIKWLSFAFHFPL